MFLRLLFAVIIAGLVWVAVRYFLVAIAVSAGLITAWGFVVLLALAVVIYYIITGRNNLP